MPHANYDLAKLAKYLHLPEKHVKKLAERGDIPGRKVKGEWVFTKEEVHHWMEQKIGVSDDQELADVEGVLAKNAVEEENVVSIADLIPDGGIEIPFGAKTKDSAIRLSTALAVKTGFLWDAEKMSEALKKREELHPTALDNGVALLHPRRPMPSIIADTFITLGIASKGIPFGGGFDSMTDIFFLICATDDRTHLRVLARLSRVLSVPGFIDELRERQTAAEVRDLIVQTEESVK